jgi:hypothetical protein
MAWIHPGFFSVYGRPVSSDPATWPEAAPVGSFLRHCQKDAVELETVPVFGIIEISEIPSRSLALL